MTMNLLPLLNCFLAATLTVSERAGGGVRGGANRAGSANGPAAPVRRRNAAARHRSRTDAGGNRPRGGSFPDLEGKEPYDVHLGLDRELPEAYDPYLGLDHERVEPIDDVDLGLGSESQLTEEMPNELTDLYLDLERRLAGDGSLSMSMSMSLSMSMSMSLPSSSPSKAPSTSTTSPTVSPSATFLPSVSPVPTYYPTAEDKGVPRPPSPNPSISPSPYPSPSGSMSLSMSMSMPSSQPSLSPFPSVSPVPTYYPTAEDKGVPRPPSPNPSTSPSPYPSPSGSMSMSMSMPSSQPSLSPSILSTMVPTYSSSGSPSLKPTDKKTPEPTSAPSTGPSESMKPSLKPTGTVTTEPTSAPSAGPSESMSPSLKPTGGNVTPVPTSRPTDTPEIVITDITVKGETTFQSEIFGRRLQQASSDCRSEDFASAVQVSLEDVIEGTLQAGEQLVGLTVSTEQAASCVFPFDANVRSTQTCAVGSSCDADAISQAAGQSVASSIKDAVTSSAADTTDDGLLGKISSEGVDTSGLVSASATVDDSNFEATPSTGVTVRIDVRTDDHPGETSWTLVDTCQGGGVVATGGGYTVKNKLETTSIQTRNSRYMFSILDAGLDGICCNNGGPGSYKVYVDSAPQISGGEFGASEYQLFGDCSEQNVTPKPTNNVVTTNPTSQPTIASTPQPTSVPTSALVSLRVSITFDSFPEDISWKLRNTCHGDTVQIASGGDYGESLRGKTIYQDVDSTPDGTFEFEIKDSYGDGLCCDMGNGTYSVSMDGEEQISMGGFGGGVGETKQFGSSDRCGPSAAPSPSPSQAPTLPTNKASYDPALGAPKCNLVHPSGTCTTVGTELLNGKENTVEQNPPNTIDNCEDGGFGEYKKAESIEAITVTASDANSGGVLSAGGKAVIKARVYAYQTGEEDMADFYYTSTPEDPVWIYISSAPATSGGFIDIRSDEFTLSSSGMQAVRVNYRWIGESIYTSSCSQGQFDDVDDLIFMVDTTSADSATKTTSNLFNPQPSTIKPITCAQQNMQRCELAERFCEWKHNLFHLKILGIANSCQSRAE